MKFATRASPGPFVACSSRAVWAAASSVASRAHTLSLVIQPPATSVRAASSMGTKMLRLRFIKVSTRTWVARHRPDRPTATMVRGSGLGSPPHDSHQQGPRQRVVVLLRRAGRALVDLVLTARARHQALVGAGELRADLP